MTRETGHDLAVDGFPHGTPQGFARGCQGGHCSNPGQSCRQADIRMHGDYQYAKLVARYDEGLATLEELQQPATFAKTPETRPEPPRRTRPERRPETRPEPKPRETRPAAPEPRRTALAEPIHGIHQYQLGCRCETCRAAKSAANRRATERRAAARLDVAPPVVPGSATGTTVVYIAGPMSGLPRSNYPAFEQAEVDLRAAGYVVLNPVRNEQFNHTGKPQTWQWYMRHSLRMIANADALALLDGWQSSDGARLELHVASMLDMPVKALADWLAPMAVPA